MITPPTGIAMLIDAEYLRQESANLLGQHPTRLDPVPLAEWARSEGICQVSWCDADYLPSDDRYEARRCHHANIAVKTGFRMRLGVLIERDNSLYERAMYRTLRAAAEDMGIDPDALRSNVEARWESRKYRQQKGVDTLFVIDLLKYAASGKIGSICLVTNDSDFAPAVHEAQQLGAAVNIVVPRPHKVCRPLAMLADGIAAIPQEVLAATYVERTDGD